LGRCSEWLRWLFVFLLHQPRISERVMCAFDESPIKSLTKCTCSFPGKSSRPLRPRARSWPSEIQTSALSPRGEHPRGVHVALLGALVRAMGCHMCEGLLARVDINCRARTSNLNDSEVHYPRTATLLSHRQKPTLLHPAQVLQHVNVRNLRERAAKRCSPSAWRVRRGARERGGGGVVLRSAGLGAASGPH
jgi:hypothetical protein